MATRIAVLPTDVLDSLFMTLEDPGASKRDFKALRFLRLPHPRTNVLSLFLPSVVSGKSSILELQSVSPPNPRSWFVSDDEVLEDGQLLLFTPIDPAFLLIPFLRLMETSDGSLGSFRPADDVVDDIGNRILESRGKDKESIYEVSDNDLSHFFSLDCVKLAMLRVCETKEIAPSITVHRYASSVVIDYLKGKATRLQSPKALELSLTMVRNLARDGLMEEGNDALLQDGRLKAACELLSQYLPKDLYEQLLASFDFTALDAHQATLRDEIASTAVANMSRVEAKESKSSVPEAAESGKKRKGKASHGVEKLKKANTKGMAKLSSFFQKAA